jgi:dTDP-4-amino-4,6-dideoxygalactose transaminase
MTEQATINDPPAIAGGTPVKRTPYAKEKRYGEQELEQLRQALAQGTLFYAHGKKVFELEKAFASHCHTRHAVACTSATAAIHAALMAVGVSPGDEVIVPPITDMGSVLPVLWQGGVPVFADLDAHTYNITTETVEKCISPKTRAIVAVHLAGNACDLDGLERLASGRKIILIEDCAQSHGATYRGKPLGSTGVIGCYSFNEFKHISCGDGGICVTNDEALARKIRLATDKAYDRSPNLTRREPKFLADNYRMTELQGAVALAQLAKLESIVSRRRSWCGRLHTRLASLPGLWLPEVTPQCEPSWWFYMLRVVPDQLGANADQFAAALKAEGVPAAAHYIQQCIYDYALFRDHSAFARGAHPFAARDYSSEQCPIARSILDTCVVLSINEAYTDDDLDDTVRAFDRVVKWFTGRR